MNEEKRVTFTKEQLDIILEAIIVERLHTNLDGVTIIPKNWNVFELAAWVRDWREALYKEFLHA